MELGDVTCKMDVQVEIATFANARDEQPWINDGGSPTSPDRHYQGCCIQGNLWAAIVDYNRLKAGYGPGDEFSGHPKTISNRFTEMIFRTRP